MYTLGPFNIVEETDRILREQSIFGQFNYLTSIIVPDEEDSNCDNSLIIDLSGYGSKNNVLQVNNVYFLLGRLVKTKESEPGYTLFYEHSSAFHMGDCQAFYAQGISRLKGKAILLSVSNGPQNLASSVSGAALGPSTRGIRLVIKPSTPTIGGQPRPFKPRHGSVAATPKASNTAPKASYSVKSSSKLVEDGEVLENDDVFVNTFPKDKGQNKRSADSSPTATPTGLSDAQKRFKQSRQ
ncbi:hypothetical protein PCASD_08350 [Puccinia coronata f. sp. avenae]|uniref:Uncharacterized protein n=1 Tax=Puccinia coronata f. sp. avenae TaxID=200324 RepID=A0A2N5USG0_9BASI|nr:hypothetical protein PCASD_08350 [Puccinia coronata f. sp. avenae]